MDVRAYPPGERLRPWVAGYTVSDNPAGGVAATVLPGLEPVLGLQYRGRVLSVRDGSLLETIGITGIQSGVRGYLDHPGTGTVLVRFHPWGAAAFLPVPMHELADRSVGLNALFPPGSLREAEERLAGAGNDADRIGVVEAFLLSLLRPRRPDGALRRAVRLLCGPGFETVESAAHAVGLGDRQLERKFREWVGVGPKRFARLARFRRVVAGLENAAASGVPAGRAFDRAFDPDFFDQAHFIKEFRAFSGTTPEAFLASLRRPLLS